MSQENEPEEGDAALAGALSKTRDVDSASYDSRQDAKQDREMRRSHSKWILGIVIVQIAFMDAVVGCKQYLGQLDAVSFNIFTSSVVLQSFGALYIVTNYLFPKRSREK